MCKRNLMLENLSIKIRVQYAIIIGSIQRIIETTLRNLKICSLQLSNWRKIVS